jgi:O-antigen ligase
MTLLHYAQRNRLTLLAFATALIAGAAIGFAVPSLVQQSLYRLIFVILGLVITLGMVVSRVPQRLMLLFVIFALPLNLWFTPFGDPPLHSGGAPEILILYLYDFPLLGLILIWFTNSMIGKHDIHIGRIEVLSLALILWSLFSIYHSVNHALTLMELVRMLKLGLLGYIVSMTILTRKDLRDALLAFIFGLLLQSILTLLQYSFNFDLGGLGFVVGDVRRVSGTVGWPNTLGAYAAAVICLPVALWICGAVRNRFLLVLSIVFGAIPVALSFSRGAWLALAISIPLMYLLALKRHWISAGGFLRQALILITLITISGFALAEQINERAEEDTISVREQLNDVAMNMVRANPLVGVGLNTFVSAMPKYDEQDVRAYFEEPVHNIFLLMAAETGVVGLAIFLILIVMVYRMGWWLIFYEGAFESATAIGLIGGLTVILITNLSDVHLRTDVIYSVWWVFIGLLLALRRGLNPARTST